MNTEISLIKKEGDLYDLIHRKGKVLELYHDDLLGFGELKFMLFDPKTNHIREIDPEVHKADFVHIHVCFKPCNDVFYAVVENTADDTVRVIVYVYEISSGQTLEFCSLTEDRDVLTGKKRIHVFILTKTQVLIQTESVNTDETAKLMGTIVFTQTLYDTGTGESIPIIEENLINNGINMIAPLNETDVLIKTGYSALEDSRLGLGSDKDALIESIYITSMAKFTGDIALRKKNIDMQLIVSAYQDRYILRPEVKDDFIVFNIVDIERRESDCVFYNYVTGEKTIGKNTEIDLEDIRLAYVVANTPYIRKNLETSCEFVNMKTLENDISFYEEDFVDVCGDLFITAKRNRRSQSMRVYQYPHMDILLDERCRYVAGIREEDAYYLYIEK